jgi:hypothetical protein
MADNTTPKKMDADVISVRRLLRHKFRQASFSIGFGDSICGLGVI